MGQPGLHHGPRDTDDDHGHDDAHDDDDDGNDAGYGNDHDDSGLNCVSCIDSSHGATPQRLTQFAP